MRSYLQTDGSVVYDAYGKKVGISHLSYMEHVCSMFDRTLNNITYVQLLYSDLTILWTAVFYTISTKVL